MIAEDHVDRLWLWLRREIRWRWLSGVFLLLTAWFAWHALHGSRGLYAYLDQRRAVQILEQDLAALEERRDALKRHQELLDSRHMDADLVEEKLLQLGWMREGDVFVADHSSSELSP
ncbi:MAG TPA: septum formation initiator family protein [Geminicoccus sp.]|jgi:cell division protein FtsB|uniref:FtsB family cell division protein n=1 Tax=Geminicoccus sp. TaxID=2024832 RepID=UPI002E32947C|nr:septum formation initiator family protein [Geminicoccus sp.]HEX2527689.1 septum formation initiator family protein [Geminicoccus sp.]